MSAANVEDELLSVREKIAALSDTRTVIENLPKSKARSAAKAEFNRTRLVLASQEAALSAALKTGQPADDPAIPDELSVSSGALDPETTSLIEGLAKLRLDVTKTEEDPSMVTTSKPLRSSSQLPVLGSRMIPGSARFANLKATPQEEEDPDDDVPALKMAKTSDEKVRAPAFGKEADGEYLGFRKQLDLWCETTDISGTKRGRMLLSELSGSAKTLALSLPTAIITSRLGMERIVEILDNHFLIEADALKFDRLNSLLKCKRTSSQGVSAFLIDLEVALRLYHEVGGEIHEDTLRLLLINGAGLSSDQRSMLEVVCGDCSFTEIMRHSKRLFRSVTAHGSFVAGHDARTGNPPGNNGQKWLKCRTCGTNEHAYGEAPKCKAALAELERIGHCSRCGEKAGHTFKTCPLRYQGGGKKEVSPPANTALIGASAELREERGGTICLLAGDALSELTSECLQFNAAVLDGGSSGTVAGTHWLSGFEASHPELERRETNARYQFGKGGETVLFSVSVPVSYSGEKFSLITDIVEGPLPLLLSRKTQIALNSTLCNPKAVLQIPTGSRIIEVPLRESKTNHWLIPLQGGA
jgi:hypothetical protein